MTEDTDTDDYEERDILKRFPDRLAHAFLKEAERVLTEYMPSMHWNAQYTKRDFAKQLVFIARHRDFISNGSCVYNFDHSGPSGDTILYHLQHLSVEDVQHLYEKANGLLLHLAKKHRLYRNVNVQLAVDFTDKDFYGEYRDKWIWKKNENLNWKRMYKEILVSMIDKDQKYPLYIEPAPASAARAKEMAELLTSVLENTFSFYDIFSARLCVDREFFNVEAINALQTFAKSHTLEWLMPAKETGRVKKMLALGVEGVWPYHIQNKKRKRAHFTLVIALNEKGQLRPFATNMKIENPRELFTIYKRRWQIETNNRSIKHPFLINTTSVHLPTRDFLMRLATLLCFLWMLINALMIREFGYNYWIKSRMFSVLLFNESVDKNPKKLKKAFTKAPLSAQAMDSVSFLSLILLFSIIPKNIYFPLLKDILHPSF